MHITKEFKYSDFILFLHSKGIDRYTDEAPEFYKQLIKCLIIENLDTVASCASINMASNEKLGTIKLTMWFE